MDECGHSVFRPGSRGFQTVSQLAAEQVVIMQRVPWMELLQVNDVDSIWDLRNFSK